MRWEQVVHYASKSDVGFRRNNNQDTCAIEICVDEESWENHGHLFLVADGMGGHAAGELASKIAADTVPHTFFKSQQNSIANSLKESIEQANTKINERGTLNRDFERMGTTCTALVLSSDGALIGHVGDSRLYRVRGQRVDQLTADHSLHWELIRQGQMRPEDAEHADSRHVITRSLGPEPEVRVDIEGPYPILPGDTYLICSDGLTGHVNDQEIGMICRSLPPAEASRLLVNLANLRGGTDNITVVVVRVGELPENIDLLPAPVRMKTALSSLTGPWLSGFWFAAISFVVGLSSMLLGNMMFGAILGSFSVIALGVLLIAWMRLNSAQKMLDQVMTADDGKTISWRAYRTADARLVPEFVNHLVTIESELRRAAVSDQWPIDEAAYQQIFKRAQAATNAKQQLKMVAEFAQAIDLLMQGLIKQREQVKHARLREAESAATKAD